LVQWTPPGKMIRPTTTENKNPDDLLTQLDFLSAQLDGGGPIPEKAAGDAVKASVDVADATIKFETLYERHAGPPDPGRIVEAERILDLIKSGQLNGTTASTAQAAASASGAPVIALDPGHGGTTISRIDPQTGLHDGDYDNPVERKQVYAV